MPKFAVATRGALAFVACCTIILGAAACGDSEDGSATSQTSRSADATAGSDQPNARKSSRGGPGSSAGTRSEPGDGSEDDRVAAVVTQMYADVAAGDERGVCQAMTVAAREQIAQQVPGGTADPPAARTCEKSLSKFFDAAARSGVLSNTLNARVRGVRIDGSRATVRVMLGGKVGSIELRREDGDWRFGADAIGGPT